MQYDYGVFSITVFPSEYSSIKYGTTTVAHAHLNDPQFCLAFEVCNTPIDHLITLSNAIENANGMRKKLREEEERKKNVIPEGALLVPADQYTNNKFVYNQRFFAFARYTNGEWIGHNGTTGQHEKLITQDYLSRTYKSGGDERWKVVSEIPTPIGYRLFNTEKNVWAEGEGHTVLYQDHFTYVPGWEMRPWYGPTLIK